MTEPLDMHSPSIREFYKSGKFSELADFFISNKLSPEGLISFYKLYDKRDNLFRKKKYWQSDLPL